jgi:hypothetical protein
MAGMKAIDRISDSVGKFSARRIRTPDLEEAASELPLGLILKNEATIFFCISWENTVFQL